MMNPKKLKRVENRFHDNVIEDYGKPGDFTEETEENEAVNEMLKHRPFINAIQKEQFDERVEEVFQIVGETLARSYGPYGATTIISQYPFYHITKDGFTIQKNLAFDKTKSFVDQIICGLMTDICGRLNNSVGDGTTTAVVATNSIYQAYRDMIEEFQEHRFLPRTILEKFEEIKEFVVQKVSDAAIKINTLDKDALETYIRNIVYVSSNGNQEMTDMIASLYHDLTYPAISVTIAPDGVTKKKIINGYKFECVLNDRLYVNSDDNTMTLHQADVVIYDHKIGLETYTKSLQPLASSCKNRGRHLICIAPFYDQVAVDTKIAADLRAEYGAVKDINLVLMTCKYQTEHHKKMLHNFALLCNTEVINGQRDLELNLAMDGILSGKTNALTDLPFNLDNRGIVGINVLINDGHGDFSVELTEENAAFIKMRAPENALRLGYVGDASLGLKSSIFSNFLGAYEPVVEACIKDAELELEETEKKYQKLGTFNVEVDYAQERLNALRLQVGILEVGANSTFAQGYLRDAIDDCVKASRSAYKYGVVPGCSIYILIALHSYREQKLKEDASDYLTDMVWRIFYHGFKNVYRTILDNLDPNMSISISSSAEASIIIQAINDKYNFQIPMEFVDAVHDNWRFSIIQGEDARHNVVIDVNDLLIRMSLESGRAFDLTTGTFSTEIINSVETDIQILHATSDLVKLLITGNQLVVSMYGQYNA